MSLSPGMNEHCRDGRAELRAQESCSEIEMPQIQMFEGDEQW